MMRLAFHTLLVMLAILPIAAHAEPSFSTGTTANAKFKSTLSPEAYTSAVNQLNTSTQQTLNQQAKNLFPKAPATIANQPASITPANQPGSISISNPPATQTTVNTTVPARPSGTQMRTPNEPAPQQIDTYTGFGGSRGGSTTKPSGGSSGLGIKY